MESAKNFPVKKIVLASSGGTVYGEPEYLPIDEEHPLKPLSPYGITKVSLENYLYFYKKNMEWTMLYVDILIRMENIKTR